MLRFALTELTDPELALQAYGAASSSPPSCPRGDVHAGARDGAPRATRSSPASSPARGWLGMALPAEYGGRERDRGRAVRSRRGAAALGRAGRLSLGRRPADRADDRAVRHRGAEAAVPAGDLPWRAVVLDRDERARAPAATWRRSRRAPSASDGGWTVTGTKIWTGGAHLNDWFVVLCRTSDEEDRHAGLTQLIVDLHSPGLSRAADPVHGRQRVLLRGEPRGGVRPRRAGARRDRRRAGPRTPRSSRSSAPARSGGCRRTCSSSSTSARGAARTAGAQRGARRGARRSGGRSARCRCRSRG